MGKESKQQTRPPQHQPRQPGREHEMEPRPQSEAREYRPAGKLRGKAAIITGGDSGIGRAVAVMFAKEGADVAVVYKDEHEDAKKTQQLVEQAGRKCLRIAGDLRQRAFCDSAVAKAVDELGRLDIVVNNAAVQYPQSSLEDITDEQLRETYETNIFAHFYVTRAALKHLREGSSIICTTSITAYRGSEHLIDYASTKGAIVAFVRSLSTNLLKSRGNRVNGVAPGPIWTPLIPATFPEEKVETFGSDVPMSRPGEPDEVAPCYVFLASDDASYMSGQILHPNGGYVLNG